MVTYLSSPKPFKGIIASNQIRAIQSWLKTAPGVEVILYGKSEGMDSAAERLGVKWVDDIETTKSGMPLFGAIAAHAAQHAKHDLQAYVNCDILLTEEFVNTIRRIPFRKFLMVGQRLDLAEDIEWSAESDWRRLLQYLTSTFKISLHPPTGSDYFGFKRGLWEGLGDIVVGRGGYDNALLLFCMRRHIAVVDATLSIPAFHQFHNYNHITGGEKEVFYGDDALQNFLVNNSELTVTLEDANWMLKPSGLSRSWSRGNWIRSLEINMRVVHRMKTKGRFIYVLKEMSKWFNMSKPHRLNISEICASNLIKKDS